MSNIIQLPLVRCFRHLSLRRVGVKPPLHLNVGSRFYCFMPKSVNVVEDIKPSIYNLKVPDDFTLIYKFMPSFIIPITTYFAAFLAIGTGFVAYQVMTEEKKSSINKEEKPPASNVDGESQLKEGKKFSWEKLSEMNWDLEEIIGENDKLLIILLLPVCILTLLNTRSGIVLCAYRKGNDYITFHTRRFGFGIKAVKHGTQDIKYYPKRKVQKHELKGEKVVFFPEHFVNENEHLMLISAQNLNPIDAKL